MSKDGGHMVCSFRLVGIGWDLKGAEIKENKLYSSPTFDHLLVISISLAHDIITYCLLPMSVFGIAWPSSARQLELVAPSPAAVGRCHAHVATPRTPREDVGRTHGT